MSRNDNELYIAVNIVKKLLSRKLKEKPNSKIVLHKGKKTEKTVRYADVLKTLESLDRLLAYNGAYSLGVCKTCSKFNPKSCSTGNFGLCGTGDKVVHEYYSCGQHTERIE